MNIKNELSKLGQHIDLILYCAATQKIDPLVLLSIALLENVNRPFWVRKIEYFFYFTGLVKIQTFGLMQIRSKIPISDEESIEIAAKYVHQIGSNDIYKIGNTYNGSNEYAKCLNYVYLHLTQLTNTRISTQGVSAN